MRSLLALWLATPFLFNAVTVAQVPGSFNVVGNTAVSAMMMFLGNEEKVYILDKVENNPTQINNHPVWAVEWDIATSQATPMEMSTNTFCAAGMHAPNGSFYLFGGNGAIGPGGNIGSTKNADMVSGFFDATYQDFDGARAVRILDPCIDGSCHWFDNSTELAMMKKRWYPGAEALPDGSVVLIGGFVNGGYVNRNVPNTDPTSEGGAAEPTFEFYPPKGQPEQMAFMTTTSGLNAYAITYLMTSGNMFVQANLSTILWNYTANVEVSLPPMPNGVVRVYPASGASAMLPLTPANNYTPTILFCGGSNMSADDYGDYGNPVADTFYIPASNDCQRITPEPSDGSPAAYTQDDDMLVGRTMGQFILLPDQTIIMINGGSNGTAGYATKTGHTPDLGSMPYDMSLAAAPVLHPALYDPSKPLGQRWSSDGLSSSTIPRLYHSSALLLPDASVLVAGSNPNVDYNSTAFFPTEYRAERFYPPYFKATTRPRPLGMPPNLSYGGDPFDITIPTNSYSGSANEAAGNTTVVLIRPGWTTHGMNMGQRLLQLNSTFTVADNGTITVHVAQVPPNPNLVTPGPVYMYVVIHGIPSNGTKAIVGNGQIGPQPTSDASVLPSSVLSSNNAAGSASSSDGNSNGGSGSRHSSKPSTGLVVALAVGAIAAFCILGVFAAVVISRKRRATASRKTIISGVKRSASKYGPGDTGFMELQQYSQADLHQGAPRYDGGYNSHGYDNAPGSTRDFDPYAGSQQLPRGQEHPGYL